MKWGALPLYNVGRPVRMGRRRKERRRGWERGILIYRSMESWAAVKKLYASMAVPQAPVRIPSQRPLAPSIASVTSVD